MARAHSAQFSDAKLMITSCRHVALPCDVRACVRTGVRTCVRLVPMKSLWARAPALTFARTPAAMMCMQYVGHLISQPARRSTSEYARRAHGRECLSVDQQSSRRGALLDPFKWSTRRCRCRVPCNFLLARRHNKKNLLAYANPHRMCALYNTPPASATDMDGFFARCARWHSENMYNKHTRSYIVSWPLCAATAAGHAAT